MRLYMGGSEIPGWRTLLEDQGVTEMSLSFMGLRRRTKFSRPWRLEDKYAETSNVFLDSGAYTVNSADEEKFSVGELRDIAAQYMAFVDANIERADLVSEFDAVVLGREWIEAMREDYWDDLPADKFLPIWHPEWGVDNLEELAQRYPRVGVPQMALDGRNLIPRLNGLVKTYGTKIHGIAMTKPDVMSAVAFDSVASTSWLSPSQYGDTIVWTGKELKRYPKRYKEQARKRHRTLFEQNGFDSEAIEADDSREVLRLSIWSWRQQIASIEQAEPIEAPEGVNTLAGVGTSPFAETQGEAVDTLGEETRKSVTTMQPVKRAPVPLPLLGIRVDSVDNGEGQLSEHPVLTGRSESMRQCNSCFLSKKCPAFAEDNSCAYSIPMQIRTKGQMKALQDSLIEMQSQRVMFMRMAEDLEGGYADPNLSGEVDRLQKMIKVATELEQDTFSLKIEAKGSNSGGAGVLSRLFGRDASEPARALPGGPVSSDDRLQVIDAEVIDVVSTKER